MSRSGYTEDCDGWDLIRWRGQVASALRGKRGQDFLREMLMALDSLPAKRLIAEELEADGEVCALGSVGRARGLDMSSLDPCDHKDLAGVFGVAHQMIQEIEYENDEFRTEDPERRFARIRAWVVSQVIVRPEELEPQEEPANLFLNCGDCGLDQGWADGACPRCGRRP